MRHRTVDVAKGIGILLVILGHLPAVLEVWHRFFNLIFSFHLPLFFILSGIFLNAEERFSTFLSKKAYVLLVPYVTALSIIWIVLVPFHDITFVHFLGGLFYATGASLEGVTNRSAIPLWFLPHLFISITLAFGLKKIATRFAIPSKYQWLYCGVSLALGVYCIQCFWALLPSPSIAPWLYLVKNYMMGLPLSIDIVLITSSFILLGSLYSAHIQEMRFDLGRFLLALCAFGMFHYVADETIDLNCRYYSNFYICTLQAILGAYIVFQLSLALAHFPKIESACSFLGRSSVLLLVLHAPCIALTRYLLPPLQNLFMESVCFFFISLALSILLIQVIDASNILRALMGRRRRGSVHSI
jgi:fucose 4-O-acetylase-like acetyltransferase